MSANLTHPDIAPTFAADEATVVTPLLAPMLRTDLRARSAPRSYDVTLDGERFLTSKLPAEPQPPRIAVVVNWFAELRTKVPR